MIVLKILLTIIRIPFTIWYVLTGWFFKIFALVGYASSDANASNITWFSSFLALEFASLTKFYNIRDADLDGMGKSLLKIAFGAGMIAGAISFIMMFVRK